MMCREYVGNFLRFFLHIPLFTIYYSLFTTPVNSFFLIMNASITLSTKSNFGANLISLYLF